MPQPWTYRCEFDRGIDDTDLEIIAASVDDSVWHSMRAAGTTQYAPSASFVQLQRLEDAELTEFTGSLPGELTLDQYAIFLAGVYVTIVTTLELMGHENAEGTWGISKDPRADSDEMDDVWKRLVSSTSWSGEGQLELVEVGVPLLVEQ